MSRSSQVQIVAPSASAEEAAAIVAALEQFMRQTAPTPVAAGPSIPAWQRAALAEGVHRDPHARSVTQYGFPT